MTVTGTGQRENRSARDLVLDISAGNAVRFLARSASNQFEHAVVLVGIHHAEGDAILGRFELVTQERTAIAPASVTSVLPAQIVKKQFVFCECDVGAEGTATLGLEFALYERDDHGQPRLVGRYQWEPRLTFHLRPPAPKPNSPNLEIAS